VFNFRTEKPIKKILDVKIDYAGLKGLHNYTKAL